MENKLENQQSETFSDESCTDVTEVPDSDFSYDEMILDADFTVKDLRSACRKVLKKNILHSWPKALLFCMLLTIPSLAVYIIGSLKMTSVPSAGRALTVIAALIPLLFGGPLACGFIKGCTSIAHGEKFRVNMLFESFNDTHILKSAGFFIANAFAYLLLTAVSLIPAVVVDMLSAGLDQGFAYVATQVITILLLITGIVSGINLYLHLSMTMPLLVRYPDITFRQAARASIRGMKGNVWKLFVVLISYAGWYIVPLTVASAVTGAVYVTGYSYIYSVFMSGDFAAAYSMLTYGYYILISAASLLFAAACSTFFIRPVTATCVLLDILEGRDFSEEAEPALEAEKPEPVGETPNSAPAHVAQDSAPAPEASDSEQTAEAPDSDPAPVTSDSDPASDENYEDHKDHKNHKDSEA